MAPYGWQSKARLPTKNQELTQKQAALFGSSEATQFGALN
jgi:hypothetical protein